MESVWTASTKTLKRERPKIEGYKKTDVLVIGGGITGILTAYCLKKAGVSCIVAEAKTIADGMSKNTTAKITAQHGLIYSSIINHLGIEKAKQYYESNTEAISAFHKLSEQYPCDFASKTAFVYTIESRDKLEKEAEAYQKLRLSAWIDEKPLIPVKTKGALAMDNQAQFNPLKLLYPLADELEIYENTFVNKIDGHEAYTQNGKITAKYIVLATHFPMINIPGFYFIKLYQHRSYVIALDNAPDIRGMYLDEKDKGLSFRNYNNLLLIGGGDHKTGKQGGCYDELRRLAKTAYPGLTEKYHWTAQDCMSLDGIPYIGRHSNGKSHIYVATGFNKWGMTGSMTSAKIITDLIVKGKNEYEELYSPQRSMFTKKIFANLGSAVTGLISIGSPRCTHMGCKLKWNSVDKSWDCSCHGSRFESSGKLINNPAKHGIKQ